MEDQMENIDHLFREELGGYTEAPPPPVWRALEKRLDNDRKKRVFPYRWFGYFAMLSFVVLLGAGIARMVAHNTAATAIAENTNAPTRTNAVPAAPAKTAMINTNITAAKPHSNTNKKHKSILTHSKTSNSSNTPIAHKRRQQATAIAQNSDTEPVHYDRQEEQSPTHGELYTYDEDNSSTVAPMAEQVAQPVDGYVVRKIRRHNLVAADMEPVAAPAHMVAIHEDNDVAALLPAGPGRHSAAGNANDNEDSRQLTSAISHKIPAHTLHKTPAPHKEAVTSNKTYAAIVAGNTVAANKHKVNNHAPATTRLIAAATPVTVTTPAAHKPLHAQQKVQAMPIAAPAPVMAAEKKPSSAIAVKRIVAQQEKKASHKPIAMVPQSGRVVEPKSTANTATAGSTVPAATSAVANASLQSSRQRMPAGTAIAANVGSIAANDKKSNATNETRKQHNLPVGGKVAVVQAATPVVSKKTLMKRPVPTAKTGKVPTAEQEPATPSTAGKKQPTATTGTVTMTHKKATAKHKQVTAMADTAAIAAIAAPVAHNEDIAAASVSSNPKISKQKSRKQQRPANAIYPSASIANNKTAIAGSSKPVKPTGKTMQKNAPAPVAKKSRNNAASTVPVLAAKQPKQLQVPGGRKAVVLRERFDDDEAAQAAMILQAAPPVAKAVVPAKPADAVATGHSSSNSAATPAATDTAKDVFKRWIAGVKGGFESGITAGAANKLVASPYLEYRLNSKFSLMVQPAIKATHIANRTIGNSTTYFDTSKKTGSYTFEDSSLLHLVTGQDLWVRNYTYKETHDSIVKSYSVGGTYVEVELPLLLKYYMTPKLSVYGGLNTGYSKLVSISEHTATTHVAATSQISTVAYVNVVAPSPSSVPAGISYTGTSLGNYSGPAYPAQQGGIFKIGYMLGFSYELKKRWMIDALVQQMQTKSYLQGGYNVNTSLSAPYIRLTLGYKLTK